MKKKQVTPPPSGFNRIVIHLSSIWTYTAITQQSEENLKQKVPREIGRPEESILVPFLFVPCIHPHEEFIISKLRIT